MSTIENVYVILLTVDNYYRLLKLKERDDKLRETQRQRYQLKSKDNRKPRIKPININTLKYPTPDDTTFIISLDADDYYRLTKLKERDDKEREKQIEKYKDNPNKKNYGIRVNPLEYEIIRYPTPLSCDVNELLNKIVAN